MISRKIQVRIVLFITATVFLSVLLGFLIVREESLRWSILCAVAIIVLAIQMVSYLNRTNRNIQFFFDSVKNDDSSLSFSVDEKGAGVKELHESMNRVNKQIQQLKIQNRQQEQYFQIILEQLATGIITYDHQGFIHHTNSAARNLLSLESLTHLRQLDRIDGKLYSVVKNLKPFERRLVGITTSRGETQLSLKSTLSGSDSKELMILSLQDIKHELDEKEIESWMKLIRVLMHEIMNSITPITSLSDSLSNIYRSGDSHISPEAVDEKKIITTLQGLKVISDQGRSLMSFVESYRKLTRIPRPEMKPVKIANLFTRVRIIASSLENPCNAGINFEDLKNETEVLADENLISMVLINLIKNALEANTDNSSCIIKVWAETGKDNHLRICVSDNGPGISEENLDKIFIPFFTTRTSGSGIGLSLSRQIMGAHGGTLNVKSVPGTETVFSLAFLR
jgi:two-component system, NtrC family, nitrogen regulation sensor histidine kinase NtrY